MFVGTFNLLFGSFKKKTSSRSNARFRRRSESIRQSSGIESRK